MMILTDAISTCIGLNVAVRYAALWGMWRVFSCRKERYLRGWALTGRVCGWMCGSKLRRLCYCCLERCSFVQLLYRRLNENQKQRSHH